MQQNNALIAALLADRAKCEQRGDRAGVAAATERLRAYGYSAQEPTVEVAAVAPTVERAAKRRVKKREV